MSDFKATDDQAPIPIPPAVTTEDLPVISADQKQDETEDDKLAQAFWHPAWDKVAEILNTKLEAYDGNNIEQYKDLAPNDFKATVLANQIIHNEIKSLMEDIKNAVEAVESRPNRPKQPKSSRGK